MADPRNLREELDAEDQLDIASTGSMEGTNRNQDDDTESFVDIMNSPNPSMERTSNQPDEFNTVPTVTAQEFDRLQAQVTALTRTLQQQQHKGSSPSLDELVQALTQTISTQQHTPSLPKLPPKPLMGMLVERDGKWPTFYQKSVV